MDTETFVRDLPKAELHLHLEGTLGPQMMFALAERNKVKLTFRSPEEAEAAYRFNNLQEFLDLYYQGCSVLQTPEDFHDLAYAYFETCPDENVLHTEVFFDPQAHTGRGVPIEHVFEGFFGAARQAEHELGLSIGFIMCFLRHLDASEGFKLLGAAAPWLDRLTAVGLDSSERDHPPQKYADVFEEARRLGLRAVAHGGEEGPPSYVWNCLELLRAQRIDHGVRAIEDQKLVAYLVEHQVPLTVCPLSNIRLCVFRSMADHSLKKLYDAGVKVTINSDDPAYFGGYINENFLACAGGLGLTNEELYRIARNSFEASFLPAEQKQAFLSRIDRFWQGASVRTTAQS